MRVLAANMVSVEGQTGATANTQAASNTQANVGFAAELRSRLVFKPSPTDPAQATVRGGAQGIGKPSEEWDQSRQVAGPSAGLQDVTAPPGSLPTTTSPKDNTPSTITLIEAAAFHLASTPDEVTMYTSGALQSFTINADGTIQGVFSNGQTRTLGQIALATFQNMQGLQLSGSNMFLATPAAGIPSIGAPNSGGRGTIVSQSLEASNVDMTTELSDLIVAVRDYQSNARAISTADQMLNYVLTMRP